MPYLMHDRPFVQLITACADIATTISIAMLARRRHRWA
jgi:hypothetical protein